MKTIARSDWSRDRAAHLLNRAGFGCTPEQADAAAKRDPAELVDELVSFDTAKGPHPARMGQARRRGAGKIS
jgi:hypothetical protein